MLLLPFSSLLPLCEPVQIIHTHSSCCNIKQEQYQRCDQERNCQIGSCAYSLQLVIEYRILICDIGSVYLWDKCLQTIRCLVKPVLRRILHSRSCNHTSLYLTAFLVLQCDRIYSGIFHGKTCLIFARCHRIQCNLLLFTGCIRTDCRHLGLLIILIGCIMDHSRISFLCDFYLIPIQTGIGHHIIDHVIP